MVPESAAFAVSVEMMALISVSVSAAVFAVSAAVFAVLALLLAVLVLAAELAFAVLGAADVLDVDEAEEDVDLASVLAKPGLYL